MKFKSFIAMTVAVGLFSACSTTENYTQYVDTTIGTGGHGHVFVGANVPFGLVQLGPTSIPQTWDWCSGYHVSDSTVIGFSHTHLSGTGIGDLFDITVMPVVGDVKYARGTENDAESGLWSYADRSAQVSKPGYYSVPLLRYGITAELTATSRVGFHRYTFPASENAGIVFDLENGGCWDKATDTHIETVGDNAIKGWRYSTGWAKDQKIYFYAEFSKPFDNAEIIENYARLNYVTTDGEEILVKVALSPVSMEGAEANLLAELSGWDFEAVVKAADNAWNKELGKVKITTADATERTKFYTALYHTMIAPSVYCDVNGDYRGADGKTYANEGFVNYTTFSLWDTYRAAMPLFSIIHPEKESDIANTMINIYRHQGKLPVWHLAANETDCMVGNPGVCALADIVMKGYEGFDEEVAYEALKASAMKADRGQDLRMQYGYIPCDLFLESVAYDMEYAIADWAVAQVAKKLGHDEDYEYFLNRSKSYKNFFDPEVGFMRGKSSKGEFRTPFNPFNSEHRADDYCEGNAWQYTWLVPHDYEGLVECFGSKEKFLEKLDALFTAESVIDGGLTSPDISGLIGQYAHGNEPSHHIIYFYTMAGQPWKTAEKVREVLTTLYHADYDGLSGNEDVGQMSAWYVLSSLGFYQVEPAGGRYYFGSPLFDRADIKVSGGTFSVVAHNNSAENIYVHRVVLNGKDYDKPYIDFADIVAGGTLEFYMTGGRE